MTPYQGVDFVLPEKTEGFTGFHIVPGRIFLYGYNYHQILVTFCFGHRIGSSNSILPCWEGFLPAPAKDGRSHCPVEWTEYRDIAKAALVLYDLILDMQE
jgi:hypothetical protein